jgi:hypothetical protein
MGNVYTTRSLHDTTAVLEKGGTIRKGRSGQSSKEKEEMHLFESSEIQSESDESQKNRSSESGNADLPIQTLSPFTLLGLFIFQKDDLSSNRRTLEDRHFPRNARDNRHRPTVRVLSAFQPQVANALTSIE